MKVYNTTELNQTLIEEYPVVGIHRNNKAGRTITLHQNPADTAYVYAVGRTDGGDTVISKELLDKALNFRIAIRLSFAEEEFLNACGDKAIAWSEVDHAIKTAWIDSYKTRCPLGRNDGVVKWIYR
ncbi:unnamed protein product [Sphagnum tenellum]